MIKDYKYTEIMCDLCGCNKQVKNRDELSGVMHDEFVNIELPATRRGVKYWAVEFQICQNCAQKIYQHISEHYEIEVPEWSEPTLREREE